MIINLNELLNEIRNRNIEEEQKENTYDENEYYDFGALFNAIFGKQNKKQMKQNLKQEFLNEYGIKSILVNREKKIVTIVWLDEDVTMSKSTEGDPFIPEAGFCIAFTKKYLGSRRKITQMLEFANVKEAEDAKEDTKKSTKTKTKTVKVD